MRLILVSKSHGRSRQINLGAWTKAAMFALVGFPAGFGVFLGYMLSQDNNVSLSVESIEHWQNQLAEERIDLERLSLERKVDREAIATQLAQMKSQLTRLDALGERLTYVADIDSSEFDFSQAPAVGGPESLAETSFYSSVEDTALSDFADKLQDREEQLQVLESILLNESHQKEITLEGRPISSGWLSSRYGYRTDPFTGKRAWHNGVDFAGREGADINTVAAGVVTWSGKRHGYGNLIEINHGNGLVSRYGHNKVLLVNAGDIVRKGQVIAKMGSTGRSTGPHVHFEVYKHGRSVDPASYINRTVR